MDSGMMKSGVGMEFIVGILYCVQVDAVHKFVVCWLPLMACGKALSDACLVGKWRSQWHKATLYW